MTCTPTPDGDVARRRAKVDEEAFTGSFSKKTPPKKTAVSRRSNRYTFKSELAVEGVLHAPDGEWVVEWLRRDQRLAVPIPCEGGEDVGIEFTAEGKDWERRLDPLIPDVSRTGDV